MKTLMNFSALGLLAIFGAAIAHADATTVSSSAVIYSAGTQGAVAASAQGSAAGYVIVPAGTSYFTFSASGTIALNGISGNYNDADGSGAAVSSSSETGSGGISGIIAPDAGYLVGVFLATGGPGATPPTTLDFTSSGGTSFTSLDPLLDQVFFIGDGLTGDTTGSTQKFFVPVGATQLYLGISDACGYNGGPSCYGDNFGNFTVDYTPVAGTTSPVPEPSSLILLGTGAFGVLGAVRRRFKA